MLQICILQLVHFSIECFTLLLCNKDIDIFRFNDHG